MRIPVLTVILCLLSSATIASSVEAEAKQSLKLWEPISVQKQEEELTVISKERRVTDQIYRAMIGGLCMGTIPRPNSLDGISEIRILNQFGRQGYVFEGGKAECAEINNMPIKKTKIHILGLTQMHTN